MEGGKILKESWKLDDQFRQEYIDFCLLASVDDQAFKIFRQNDRIKTIIENTSVEWAIKAMNGMSVQYTNEIGSPDALINGLAATTVRYIYTLNLIKRLTKNRKTIVEIGGGYGGQCRIIHEHMMPDSYTIYDLPEVQKLQQRFLKEYNITPTFKQGIPESENYDLCVSWCGWSELNRETKQEYAEKVISKAKNIFICSNYNKIEDVEILSKYFDVKEFSNALVTGVLYS